VFTMAVVCCALLMRSEADKLSKKKGSKASFWKASKSASRTIHSSTRVRIESLGGAQSLNRWHTGRYMHHSNSSDSAKDAAAIQPRDATQASESKGK